MSRKCLMPPKSRQVAAESPYRAVAVWPAPRWLPLAYALVLPFSHRFNRYLVPALPAYAIVAVIGLRAVLANLGRTAEARTQLDSLRVLAPGHSAIAWLEQRIGMRR